MATLYVNGATGDDSRSYATAQSSSTPWQTIERARKGATFGSGANAAQAAAAGDTVIIEGGVYEATASNAVFTVALNPVNAGTSGNPIIFKAADNARDAIRIVPRSGSGTGSSPIGSVDKNYIHWIGFDLNETDWPWNGPNDYENGKCLFYGTSNTLTGCLLEKSRLTGTVTAARDGDNYTGVRIHGASATIRNNEIRNFGLTDHNTSGMTTYLGFSLTIENNWFHDCGSGIYLKNNASLGAGLSQHILRKNLIEDVGSRAILWFQNANGDTSTPVLVYQNIIVGGAVALWVSRLGGGAESADPQHAKFLNNTCVNQTDHVFEINGSPKTNAALAFHNNICTGAPLVVLATGGAGSGDIVTSKVLWEHNVYHGFTTFANWAGLDSSMTLAEWQAQSQDNTAPIGLDDDPEFTNAGTGDYTLQGTSPALTRGRAIHGIGGADGTTIPSGAYITGNEVIGLTDDSGEEPPVTVRGAAPVFALAFC